MSSHAKRGDVFLTQKRWDLALVEYLQALHQEPTDRHAIVHALIADCYLKLRQPEKAMQNAKQALQLSPEYGLAHRVMAGALCALGKRAEALKHADEGIRLEPDEDDAHYTRALVLFRQNDHHECLKNIDAGLQLNPESVELLNLRAQINIVACQNDGAAAALNEALSLDPEIALTHVTAGWMFFKQNDYAAAEREYREALRLEPNFPEARRGLAYAVGLQKLLMRPIQILFIRTQNEQFYRSVISTVLVFVILIHLVFSVPAHTWLLIPLVIFRIPVIFVSSVTFPLSLLLVSVDPKNRYLVLRPEVLCAAALILALSVFFGITIYGVTQRQLFVWNLGLLLLFIYPLTFTAAFGFLDKGRLMGTFLTSGLLLVFLGILCGLDRLEILTRTSIFYFWLAAILFIGFPQFVMSKIRVKPPDERVAVKGGKVP